MKVLMPWRQIYLLFTYWDYARLCNYSKGYAALLSKIRCLKLGVIYSVSLNTRPLVTSLLVMNLSNQTTNLVFPSNTCYVFFNCSKKCNYKSLSYTPIWLLLKVHHSNQVSSCYDIISAVEYRNQNCKVVEWMQVIFCQILNFSMKKFLRKKQVCYAGKLLKYIA